MKTRISSLAVAALVMALPLGLAAQESNGTAQQLKGTTDAQTGASTRAWLKEQAQGTNRGETEPYRAESAGKAYRSYVDSIGAKNQAPASSQLSTISTK
ncbi:MAG TPA: hypothetical protein VFV57_03460 [Limnobacter sp.]|nr:hypothetical protein [Limnobacter sp.]